MKNLPRLWSLVVTRFCVLRRIFVPCLFLSCFCAEADTNIEKELKAAYLVHLVKFVSWSEPVETGKVWLCFNSLSPIAKFEGSIRQRSVGNGRVAEVLLDPAQLNDCDLLFWDEAANRATPGLLASAHPGLLVVTDIAGGFGKGAVQFFSRDLKLRFAVNEAVLDKASFQISSKLLRLARELN
ncbi:MAG: YfiR family protein [Porticoccaceae bacterium]|nr:YfiR family protein [Pseudomonadales bacterium]MCP5170816.1 YfiR family protein [Pseudomonadales bacterium]MCP5301944.1 YfiR family protein [Pseudomonadales bacterium]